MMIRDPDTFTGAEVNSQKQLVVRAVDETELEHAASEGNAYSWDSAELNIDAGDTMLFVKNTSTTPLILDRLIVNGSNVICTWDINIGSETTTPAGTAIAGVNLNRSFSANLADVVSMSDETALADGDTVDRVKTAITSTVPVNLDGIILGNGHYIQVNQETASTSGSSILYAHFENPS